MPDPREPSEQPPMPPPDWKPEPPIDEPEPDRLPDEVPLPNPDESDAPPLHAFQHQENTRFKARLRIGMSPYLGEQE